MTDTQSERDAIALFEAMLDVPEGEREAWIAARTAGRPALRDRVSAMRAADHMVDLQTGAAVETLEEELPPDRIGAYRVAERIGRGGMGSVYRGERATGDFVHNVAIKIVKPGLLSETLIDRFQRERQTLATLSHPNIAQLYDGGETGTGSPYIVMELVDGLPLLQWADAHAPSRGERRRLFRDICGAVAFAHRNLIVHRDLTPSNVLVTRDGTVKLIDFGIAKPADGPADAHAGPTSIGSLSLTPGYAAPERTMSSEVTTAADIYSLGKLLEKLVEPGAGDADLRAIIDHATAPLPQDRYPTVDALSADVAAWGNDMPVAAAAGGRRYVLRKFVARHRIGVAASVGALALLIGAFGLTLYANQRAEAARAAESTRFGEVRSLAHYLLFDLNDQLRRVAGNTRARADLAGEAQSYLTILAKGSGDREDLKFETAQGLIQLARIQGSPNEPNLGQPEKGAANFAAAELLLTGLTDTPVAAKAPALAEAQAFNGLILLGDEMRQPQAAGKIAAARRTLDLVPSAQRGADWYDARRTVLKAEIDLADIGSKPDEMAALASRLDADIRDWPAAMQNSGAALLDRAQAAYLRALRESESKTSHSKDFGLTLFLQAEKLFDAVLATDPNDPVTLLLAANFFKDGYAAASRADAEAIAQRLILRADGIAERLIGIDDRDEAVRKRAASIKEGLAQNYRDHDRFDEAIALQRKVLALRAANIGPDRNARRVADLGFSQMIMGLIARTAGNRALACESWTTSAASVGELERRNQLVGFMKDFLPGLRDKAALCIRGVPLNGLQAPLR
jgi:eukaryotic-like serine/threonine-protein kinase